LNVPQDAIEKISVANLANLLLHLLNPAHLQQNLTARSVAAQTTLDFFVGQKVGERCQFFREFPVDFRLSEISYAREFWERS
jgi:hypothetical protein